MALLTTERLFWHCGARTGTAELTNPKPFSSCATKKNEPEPARAELDIPLLEFPSACDTGTAVCVCDWAGNPARRQEARGVVPVVLWTLTHDTLRASVEVATFKGFRGRMGRVLTCTQRSSMGGPSNLGGRGERCAS